MDWANNTVSFYPQEDRRAGAGPPRRRALNLLQRPAQRGPLFPYLSRVRAGDRATEFKQRCQGLGIRA